MYIFRRVKIYANIPTNLRLSILLTIQTEKDILEPYSILTELQKTEKDILEPYTDRTSKNREYFGGARLVSKEVS